MALPGEFGTKAANVAEQLVVWGALQQLLGAMMTPLTNELTRAVNNASQTVPLTPAELADMTNRHILALQDAINYAKQSGTSPSDFARMVAAAGDGPAPGDLVEALRRGLIPERGQGADSISFEQGISESRIRNKWLDTIKALGVRDPTPNDALDALLEGQIGDAEARDLYHKFGGNPEYFTLLYDTRGSAPTPLEAAEMAKRGIIPWDGEGPDVTSFHQAFLEGPWRNKWEPGYRQLADYRPPMRTIVAMLRSGAIDDTLALKWFHELGADDQVAGAMLADAHHHATTTSKELTSAEVTGMYVDGLLSKAEAEADLIKLKFSQSAADLLLQHAQLLKAQQGRNAAVTKIRTQFLARALDRGQASNALDALGVPHDARDSLLVQWQVELDNSVKRLTEAQLAAAFHYQIIDQPTAQAGIQAWGYTAHDAWVLLSTREHAKLPNEP